MTEHDSLLSMIEDQQSEIADLRLCLKETNILLVASIGRNKKLEEIIYETSHEHAHSCRCGLCEVWKEREGVEG